MKKKCLLIYEGGIDQTFKGAGRISLPISKIRVPKKKSVIFIICPVRNATPNQESDILSHIDKLEAMGHSVHYPKRDTDQNDTRGLRICADNREAIKKADEVHVYWTGSEGSCFDIGMAMAMEKPMFLINKGQPTDINIGTLNKETADMIKNHKKALRKTHRFDDENYTTIEDEIHILWKTPPSGEMLFNLGVLFGSDFIDIVLIKKVSDTAKKSFDNVIIDLAAAYAENNKL